MKLSKKILAAFGVAAMLVVAGSFTACKSEDDDDPYEMIAAQNKSYFTINHTNSDADTVHRGYKTTTFSHAGALVDITFNTEKSDNADGVMGIVFGLESNEDGSRNFYVFGARNKGDYYISRFKNVSDLQGNNFGAESGHQYKIANTANFETDKETAELEIKDFTTANDGKLKRTNSSVSFTVFYKDTVDTTKTESGYKHTYEIYLLDANSSSAYSVKDSTGDVVDNAGNVVDLAAVAEDIASIDYYTSSDSATQRPFALYANVYPNTDNCSADYKSKKTTGTGTVKGYWKVQGDFKHADIVED